MLPIARRAACLRLVERHAVGLELVDEEFEMEGELATQLFVGRVFVEQGAEALPHDSRQASRCHARSSKKPTADESRLQDSNSRSS